MRHDHGRGNYLSWRVLLGLVVALGVGGLHFALVFSDLAQGETLGLRVLGFYVAGLLGGSVLGLLVERKWPVFCILCTWGAMLGATMLFLMREDLWVHVGPGSIASILFGGAVGAQLRKLGPFKRLLPS